MLRVERVRPRERAFADSIATAGAPRFLALVVEALEHETEVVDGVRRFWIDGDTTLEHAPRLVVVAELEEDLTFEGVVETELAAGLGGATHEEERALEIVLVEERLALQVVDLGLEHAIGPRQARRAREQLVGESNGGRELAELLDQQLDAIEMRRRELAVRERRSVEFDQRLVQATVVPEDLAATVVGLGALGMHAQGFVEPGERLLDPSTVGGLHGLVQAVPVAILVLAHRAWRLVASRVGPRQLRE